MQAYMSEADGPIQWCLFIFPHSGLSLSPSVSLSLSSAHMRACMHAHTYTHSARQMWQQLQITISNTRSGQEAAPHCADIYFQNIIFNVME